jgi:hypothetical protein
MGSRPAGSYATEFLGGDSNEVVRWIDSLEREVDRSIRHQGATGRLAFAKQMFQRTRLIGLKALPPRQVHRTCLEDMRQRGLLSGP